jgi:hypothetical protein
LKSPSPSTISLVRYSLYKLNKLGDKQHPCQTPLPIFTLLVSPRSSRTLTFCSMSSQVQIIKFRNFTGRNLTKPQLPLIAHSFPLRKIWRATQKCHFKIYNFFPHNQLLRNCVNSKFERGRVCTSFVFAVDQKLYKLIATLP